MTKDKDIAFLPEFDSYKPLRKIGSGGQADVFLALTDGYHLLAPSDLLSQHQGQVQTVSYLDYSRQPQVRFLSVDTAPAAAKDHLD